MSSASHGGSDRKPNRLASESSPYLLQHAFNPVDWWPWCADAFEEARRRDVPVFLSIGYSTCYWCHVMERESFEDDDTARLMNERFVAIKVDREERPEVDDIYMAATQVLTGHGGWPMSVFLEPKTLRPFWAGTYYPPEPRHGLPSFKQVLEGMSDAYREKRAEVIEQAEKLGEAVEEHLAAGAHEPVALGMEEVSGAVGALLKLFDRTDGGFGRAPKFPQPVNLDLLLDARRSAGDEATRGAVDHALKFTLDQMAAGGMFDQVGGGFHRYSVDAHWTVPHFEKMLYDNAMLLGVYADAARMYEDGSYARVVARTIGYLLREMRVEVRGSGESGGFAFATAQDAEVDGREGKNYVWTREELVSALGEEDGAFACRVYGVDAGPNFKDPHHPDEPAVSVLRLEGRPDRIAAAMGMEVGAFLEKLDAVNEKLLAVRAGRKQPHVDDKIIAGWNGLMIAGLARAGDVDARALNAARRAANFLIEHMIDEDATLYRIGKIGAGGGEGEGVGVKHAAPLEDYAFVMHGMTTLARRSEPDRQIGVTVARALAARARDLFWDEDGGGFYDTMPEAPDLFVRARSTYDGAIPCGTSVMIHALIDLHELTGERAYLEDAVGTLAAISAAVKASPVSTANSTRALLRLLVGGMIEESGDESDVPAGGAGASERSIGEGDGLRTPIEVYAGVERVTVKPDEPAEVMVKVRVLPGYHVISPLSPVFAAGNGAPALVPLHVHIIGGSGVRVYADYPEGTPLASGAVEGLAGVNGIDGEFDMRLAIERDPDQPWKGNPLIAITFQACTDTACERARTLELDVAIDRG